MIPVILFRAVSTRAQATDDKASLEEQDRVLRQVALARNWTIIDVITVPGVSRDFYTFREFADFAAAQGATDPLRMFEHWTRQDFKVFMVWDGSRFGREMSIFAEVVARTIDAGAVLYVHQSGGVIDKSNSDMFAAMGGYAAKSEVRKLVERRKLAMKKRAADGLLMGSTPPLSHRIIRDELGRALRVEVREELRRLWDDVAAVLIGDAEHPPAAFWHFERTLYERFGHVNPATGKPYREDMFYRLLLNPVFWGHTFQNRHGRKLAKGEMFGTWVFDDREPPPDGITVNRNVLPAVYTGKQAELVKAELRRRKLMRGRARPGETHAFTGLVICGSCTFNMIRQGKKSWTAYRCVTYTVRYNARGDCPSKRRSVSHKSVEVFVDKLLRLVLAQGGGVLDAMASNANNEQRREQIKAELEAVEREVNNLIARLALVPESMLPNIEAHMKALAERQGILHREYADLNQQRTDTHERDNAIAEIRRIGLSELWGLPEHRINQLLHQVMGNYRVVVVEGQPQHISPAPNHRRR